MANNNKNAVIEPKTLAGFMELLPNKQILFNRVLDAIRNSYESFGFLPLDTPNLEYSSVLFAKAGDEVEKQVYRFTKGDTDMALRFDLTVPLAKYVAKNYHNLAFPFRRYQIGKVYRGERPQKGRFREFYQADIDIIGDGSLNILCDGEIPAIIATVFKNLGFNEFKILISNRKILQGFLVSLGLAEKTQCICSNLDKLKKIGVDKVRAELEKIELKKVDIDKILEFAAIEGTNTQKLSALSKIKGGEVFNEGVEELKAVVGAIDAFGVDKRHFEIDLTIVRGLDYYTGTVFETFLTGHEDIGSVCSGGRYDNLAGLYIDKQLPGVGISIGLTRLFDKLESEFKIKNIPYTDVLVVSLDEDKSAVLKIATLLREKEIKTLVYLEDSKLKTKFKYAEKLEIPYMAIIGESERANGTVTLKNIVNGEQHAQISIDQVVEILTNNM